MFAYRPSFVCLNTFLSSGVLSRPSRIHLSEFHLTIYLPIHSASTSFSLYPSLYQQSVCPLSLGLSVLYFCIYLTIHLSLVSQSFCPLSRYLPSNPHLIYLSLFQALPQYLPTIRLFAISRSVCPPSHYLPTNPSILYLFARLISVYTHTAASLPRFRCSSGCVTHLPFPLFWFVLGDGKFGE